LINIKASVNQIIFEYKQREKKQIPLCFVAKKGKGYKGYKKTIFEGKNLLFKTPYRRSQLQHQLLGIEPSNSLNDFLFKIKSVECDYEYAFDDNIILNVAVIFDVYFFSDEDGGEGCYRLIYDKEVEYKVKLFEYRPVLSFSANNVVKLDLDCIGDIFMEKDLKEKVEEIKQEAINFLKGE
jgi:hypothetical protein